MHVYEVLSLSLDLNWLQKFVEFAENKIPIYDRNNFRPWVSLFIILAILVHLRLRRLAEDGDSNSNNKEEEQSLRLREEELLRGEIVQSFEDGGDEQAGEGTTAGGGVVVVGRHGGCAFCGDVSTTRCSRCKAARYCSVECQIRHWRSGHRYECVERETARIVKKPKKAKESFYAIKAADRNSECGAVDVPSDDSSHIVVSSGNGCAICGKPSTTKCSRCKAVTYCSAKCLIKDWTWHKVKCDAQEVNPAHAKVGIPNNISGEEDNIQSSSPLLLEFSPETRSTKPLTEGSLVPIKKAQDHNPAERACLEEELAKLRNETKLLKSERDKWLIRANFGRQRYQSFKKESEHQLHVLKHEKELISNAEKQACNVIDNLSEKLHQLQTKLQAGAAEKIRQEEYIRMLESEWAKTKRELQEERMRVWWPAASLGRTAIVCSICLTNEKDLAFGCGHMTCEDCGSKISKCPICREQINNRVKLFPG